MRAHAPLHGFAGASVRILVVRMRAARDTDLVFRYEEGVRGDAARTALTGGTVADEGGKGGEV